MNFKIKKVYKSAMKINKIAIINFNYKTKSPSITLLLLLSKSSHC